MYMYVQYLKTLSQGANKQHFSLFHSIFPHKRDNTFILKATIIFQIYPTIKRNVYLLSRGYVYPYCNISEAVFVTTDITSGARENSTYM